MTTMLSTLIAGAAAGDGPAKSDDTSTPAEWTLLSARAQDGARIHRLRSPHQRGETLLRVLAPKVVPKDPRVVFLLPVEPQVQSRFGDGLTTARRLGLQEKLGAILVAPTFAALPWYADHPTDPRLRQETYMMRVVVPLTTALHPHRPERRGLLGFSKSGWGAWSLLLRNPDAFAAAVAWDAPMMMETPRFGMDKIVGDRKTFEAYRIPTLLRTHAAAVRARPRLGLLGFGNFRDDHVRCHALLQELKIPHTYADGPKQRHHWDGGWLPNAAQTLHDLMDGK
ncbi:hypothetical protein HQ560_12885 [bacterium]|nr:hypothetical protein [bacterium]